MSISKEFILAEIENQTYELSLHADGERIAEEITISQLESALLNYQILEKYPDDTRGESCLTLSFTPEGKPIHVVCGRNPSGHLIIITVYIPTMPKWRDPYSRKR